MTDYNKELDSAQEALVKTYLEQVKTRYLASTLEQRAAILRGLENLLSSSVAGSAKSVRSHVDQEAIDIRLRAGLTQEKLARQLNLTQSCLSRYEQGYYPIGASKFGKGLPARLRYLAWLKTQGYKK